MYVSVYITKTTKRHYARKQILSSEGEHMYIQLPTYPFIPSQHPANYYHIVVSYYCVLFFKKG